MGLEVARAILKARAVPRRGEAGWQVGIKARFDREYAKQKEYKRTACRLGGAAYECTKAAKVRYIQSVGVFKPRPWSYWEEKFILDNHAGYTDREIALALGRGIDGCRKKRKYLLKGRKSRGKLAQWIEVVVPRRRRQ